MSLIHLKVILAIEFAANQHTGQRRKGSLGSPYINHPIKVVSLLLKYEEYNSDLLSAAALHDVVEDTAQGEEEKQRLIRSIEEVFGSKVLQIVREVTDDKNLPFHERKEKQIENTPSLSEEAKKIKIADKICNIQDIIEDPPTGWSKERKNTYLDWAGKVIEGAKGVNEQLENYFETIRREAYKKL
jgi:guanosine-3',5'-bis(diphosphate) 3'-pyrophosphohydrolase